ncbi:MAG: hypothetical protein EOR51_12060 [Mesorhizobium sp.]|uniref:hypothetical protein n=1 Tax=Mesorhizobium sp. TaxID=1871066 RepID=UPI000FE73AE8|nr:hypothetical protein [Mesorhizobium sp.]RWK79637.1 MAG: hypothetical protein EOR50_05790 [Mesorhizobium sp.]RWK82413.1 MAG: hypothetical protein EOR51_12060 [Mesorhizobium sp.]RWL08768.1 MAG: hypothetical protein EOR55_03490 [Mesorhizobium sp.]
MSTQLAAMAEAAPVIVDAGVINDNDAAGDSALEAIWNKNERDNGAERDNGKFVSSDRATAADTASPKGGEGGEPAGDGLTPGAGSVPLPENWKGIQGADAVKGAWEKTPAEVRAFVAQREQELQGRLSDHGRQLSTVKPIQEVIDRHAHYFDPQKGRKLADGSVVTPAKAIDFLFNAQANLDRAPVESIMSIIDSYGVRDKIAAAFGHTVQQGETELRQEIAGLKTLLASVGNPANIDDRISQKLQERIEQQSAADELTRLSADKPLYSEIPEVDMVEAIHKARRKLGDAASKEAVFGLAYDMAVNADPDLRAKAAAGKPAATNGAAKVEGARRAAAVNIPSTASGKGRALTEDEELAAVYERNQKG